MFFLFSKLAVFDGKKAIRGGIPFVFPQFGPWSFGPNHGFARIVRWTLERGPERLPNGDVEAVLSLMDSDFTRSMWNYPWVEIIRLMSDLLINLFKSKVSASHIALFWEKKNFTSTLEFITHRRSLHSPSIYFSIRTWKFLMFVNVKLPGFMVVLLSIRWENSEKFKSFSNDWFWQTRDGAIYQEGREVVTINEWTDRIYQHTSQEHIITNVVSGRKMRLQKYNFPDSGKWLIFLWIHKYLDYRKIQEILTLRGNSKKRSIRKNFLENFTSDSCELKIIFTFKVIVYKISIDRYRKLFAIQLFTSAKTCSNNWGIYLATTLSLK